MSSHGAKWIVNIQWYSGRISEWLTDRQADDDDDALVDMQFFVFLSSSSSSSSSFDIADIFLFVLFIYST